MITRFYENNEGKYGYPRDCTTCYWFIKPKLADPEDKIYRCGKGHYMPKWSHNYAARCKNYICPNYTVVQDENGNYLHENNRR